ncbi:uncharacterized protein LY79DRAFT_197761 [Colletotrichum navitas]|uniref:Uncharacterized protein n=1 Tax=Colletotrichum navitas TaxID=681940 RepID=A0AAD8PZ54_9PEZI|nr:uncharacterized protein LY79DRAFT_197761 [Colletotrichum navitas]KAK1590705.1 hypothetical protein LY79DRAFT_197761 [Colletotrichum navitas]
MHGLSHGITKLTVWGVSTKRDWGQYGRWTLMKMMTMSNCRLSLQACEGRGFEFEAAVTAIVLELRPHKTAPLHPRHPHARRNDVSLDPNLSPTPPRDPCPSSREEGETRKSPASLSPTLLTGPPSAQSAAVRCGLGGFLIPGHSSLIDPVNITSLISQSI